MSEWGVTLSEIVNNFPELLLAARRKFGKAVSLRLRIDTNPLLDNEIELLDFDWETESRDDNPIDYLFTWISDLAGRRACFKTFSAIKSAIRSGENSLALIVHHGYFFDEMATLFGYDEDEVKWRERCYRELKTTVLLTEADVLNNKIPVNQRLDGFFYAMEHKDVDEDEYAWLNHDKDELRVFISLGGSVATDVFDVPFQIPKTAFLHLFPIIGYKIRIDCNKYGSSVHSVIISW